MQVSNNSETGKTLLVTMVTIMETEFVFDTYNVAYDIIVIGTVTLCFPDNMVTINDNRPVTLLCYDDRHKSCDFLLLFIMW